MNDAIINIESLNKSFVRDIVNVRGESEDERFMVIDDLSLFIPRGKITALIGGNGAGKTTLFNIISGFTKADRGSVSYNGNGKEMQILGLTPFKIARLGIGRFFQDNHIFREISVLDNMLIADENHFGEKPFEPIVFPGKSKMVELEKVNDANGVFNTLFGNENPFWQKRYDRANSLSFGQQRLLELSRLMMGKYKLLLLDEPTSGVHSTIIEQQVKLLRDLVEQKGYTIFLIEHNMKFVLDVADFCCFMSHGKVAALGTPEDVIGNDEVRKTYMGV